MRNSIFAAAAIAAGFSTMAFAQTDGTAFSGPYFGGQIGYDALNAGLYYNSLDISTAQKGVEGGIFAGYNFRKDNLVVGLEGQFSLSDASGSIDEDYFEYYANYSLQMRTRESYGLIARIGTVIGQGTLAYVHGGWVNTKFEFDDGYDPYSERLDGWKVGVGLETYISQTVTLRAEYAYSDYENSDDFEPKNSSFRVGVAYQF